MKAPRFLAVVSCLLLSATCLQGRADEPEGFNGFDAFIEAQLDLWKVPGAAVAVVRDGEILFVKGYGFRDLEKRLPMTPDSVVPIGSIAKTLLAISTAKLVRQGKLQWDRPVREWAPDFQLANDSFASQMTLRDMLSHRTPFAGSNWAWYGAPQSAEDLYRKMRFFELRGGFRERYQYSDLIYGAAGVIAARVAGKSSWEELAQKDVFDPLGMKSAGFRLADYVRQPDYSSPYGYDAAGNPALFEPLEAHWMGPAGGFVYASTADMAKYLAMLSGGGSYRGVSVVEQADLVELTTPNVTIPARSPYPELGQAQYGLGFFTRPHRGYVLISHTGTNSGWHTRLAYFPHLKSGVYVAYNVMEEALQGVLSNPALDRLLGVEPADWSGRAIRARAEQRAAAAEVRQKQVERRKKGTTPSRALEEFVGTYTHAGYGNVHIMANNTPGEGKLRIGFRVYEWPLDHVHFDVFEAPPTQRSRLFDPLAGLRVQFLSGVDGEITSLRFWSENQIPNAEFARKAD
jgi:CubicO group peptidase (beta-lactamase class C family)